MDVFVFDGACRRLRSIHLVSPQAQVGKRRRERIRQEEERRRRRETLVAKYGSEQVADDIMAHKIWQGMTSEQLVDSWGQPADVTSGSTSKRQRGPGSTVRRVRIAIAIGCLRRTESLLAGSNVDIAGGYRRRHHAARHPQAHRPCIGDAEEHARGVAGAEARQFSGVGRRKCKYEMYFLWGLADVQCSCGFCRWCRGKCRIFFASRG